MLWVSETSEQNARYNARRFCFVHFPTQLAHKVCMQNAFNIFYATSYGLSNTEKIEGLLHRLRDRLPDLRAPLLMLWRQRRRWRETEHPDENVQRQYCHNEIWACPSQYPFQAPHHMQRID